MRKVFYSNDIGILQTYLNLLFEVQILCKYIQDRFLVCNLQTLNIAVYWEFISNTDLLRIVIFFTCILDCFFAM